MLFQLFATLLLPGVARAAKLTEHDKLAAKGLANVADDVARHGYPKPGLCTLETAAVRKEWYVSLVKLESNFLKLAGHCSARPRS
jgi:tyrosinase